LKAKVLAEDIVHCDACGGVVKPEIVFFGEAVLGMDEASRIAGRADLFFVIGSSLTVYPAALLPEYAGGRVVVVNPDPIGREKTDEELAERLARWQWPDGGWNIKQPDWDVHACFDAVFILRQLGESRNQCGKPSRKRPRLL
jgi:NAD-dependent SIR2 family protein deacetylase